MKKKLVICGGGSSAHTLIPLLDGSIFDVSIYTSRPAQWHSRIDLEWHNPAGEVLGTYSGALTAASSNPAELIPSADYIVFCMPVHQYRVALHAIAPYIDPHKTVFIGTLYGQGGWNWMINEVKTLYGLDNIVAFAFGLIPWVCRIIQYGKTGVTYGCKAANYAACTPASYFPTINAELLDHICHHWFGKGAVQQCSNFLSLTLSVDNQIIHTSRCLGLYKVHGLTWQHRDDVPWFYKDYDDLSANLLSSLDAEYTLVRNAIKALHPERDYRYMMDYLALERFSYQSHNTDIKQSFVTSQTLTSIGTPVVQNAEGLWEIDRSSRFFLDDIYYGNCIAKWMAEQLGIPTPTIDEILRWAQMVRQEAIIGPDNHLLIDSPDLKEPMKSGIPAYYGFHTIEDCID